MQGVSSPRGGIATSQSPPFTLPMRYLLLGVVGFGVFALDLAWQSTALGANRTWSPGVVALTHTLTLGSLLAFVMGAVYQLTTVAFLIPIRALRVARLNFWLYAVGATGLVVSMAQWWLVGMMVFGSLTAVSIYLYAGLIAWSIATAKTRGTMLWFVGLAHLYLAVAVTVAWLMIVSLQGGGFLAGVIEKLLWTHILFATGGFFTFLVMGFSFKLVPMFTLAHGFSGARQTWTLLFANLALWGLVAGVWVDSRLWLWGAGVVGLAAFVNHGMTLFEIVKKRLRKVVEVPLKAVLAAALVGMGAVALLLLQLGMALQAPGWQGVVALYVMGWITLSVMGFAYKIVPFLIWNQRFSKNVEKNKTPMIADLLHPHHARPALWGFTLGLLLLTVGTMADWFFATVVACVLISLSILVFCVQMLIVIHPKKVIKELTAID